VGAAAETARRAGLCCAIELSEPPNNDQGAPPDILASRFFVRSVKSVAGEL
jgi:hypothetical protein